MYSNRHLDWNRKNFVLICNFSLHTSLAKKVAMFLPLFRKIKPASFFKRLKIKPFSSLCLISDHVKLHTNDLDDCLSFWGMTGKGVDCWRSARSTPKVSHKALNLNCEPQIYIRTSWLINWCDLPLSFLCTWLLAPFIHTSFALKADTTLCSANRRQNHR